MGSHLVAAQDRAIEKVVNALRDTYKVDFIAPGHCTGEPTFTALQKALGDRYLYPGLGGTLTMGASPRAALNQRDASVLDDGDSGSYRTFVAQNVDLYVTSVGAVRPAQGR